MQRRHDRATSIDTHNRDAGVLLYLHGRGDSPLAPPGDTVVAGVPSSHTIRAPEMAPTWFARPFREQLETVNTWLDTASVAVGHSMGAWLLLCASLERCPSRGAPPLVLLSSVLGVGRSGDMGFAAPRARRVRPALGLGGQAPSLSRDGLVFVHGSADGQCPVEDLHLLARHGFSVDVVPGVGHRLEGPAAAKAIRAAIQRAARDRSVRFVSPEAS